MAEEMNVDMLAPDELVFHRIAAPTRFAAVGAGLPAGAVMFMLGFADEVTFLTTSPRVLLL